MWIVVGALSGLIAVAAGAFGAHGLKERLPADLLAVFETSARYQIYHALAMAMTGLLLIHTPRSRVLSAAAAAFLIGTLFFCGSLYALAFSGERRWGAVAPLGGAAFMLGWLLLAVGAARRKAGPTP